MTELSRLVRSKIDRPETGQDDGDWYCQLYAADKGGEELYKLEQRAHQGIHVVRAQGVRSKTLPEACETLANALEFPSYYGRNADAFNECLFDLLDLSVGGLGSMFGLAGRPVASLVLIIDTAEQFLSDESKGQASAFFSVLAKAAHEKHADKQAEFFVCFIGEQLPSGLRDHG